MTALYILAAVLLVLFLIGQVRVGGRVEYGGEGLFAWVRFGAFSIKVLPLKKKPGEKVKKPKKKKLEKPKETRPKAPVTQRLGGALDYARALMPIALEAAGQFYGKLRMDHLELELTAGSPDPADAAALYGQASAALGAFWYPLTQAFHVRDGRAQVRLDFDAPEMKLYANASLSLKIGQLLWLGVYFGVRALRAFLSVRRAQKIKRQQRKAV